MRYKMFLVLAILLLTGRIVLAQDDELVYWSEPMNESYSGTSGLLEATMSGVCLSARYLTVSSNETWSCSPEEPYGQVWTELEYCEWYGQEYECGLDAYGEGYLDDIRKGIYWGLVEVDSYNDCDYSASATGTLVWGAEGCGSGSATYTGELREKPLLDFARRDQHFLTSALNRAPKLGYDHTSELADIQGGGQVAPVPLKKSENLENR